jgi:hypothetical protein
MGGLTVAGKGFAPDEHNALQRGRDKVPTTPLRSHDRVYGFDLPDDALGETIERDADGKVISREAETWHPIVLRWWEAWRRSPQAVTMSTDADWFELLACARLYQDYWTKTRGRTMLAAELRQRMAKFGATHEDRLRLRLSVELGEPTPIGDPGEGATVTNLDDRRARLGG